MEQQFLVVELVHYSCILEQHHYGSHSDSEPNIIYPINRVSYCFQVSQPGENRNSCLTAYPMAQIFSLVIRSIKLGLFHYPGIRQPGGQKAGVFAKVNRGQDQVECKDDYSHAPKEKKYFTSYPFHVSIKLLLILGDTAAAKMTTVQR
ncbi:hypothetical protein E2C01_033825 [Portunus trituberculatus]|uniref:Uncharacterized protein n=1 Tax=Portunus trituberculatus TaxID=210409 RepID=A0A5B7F4T1_PORTR|nr:hypothetical protein [Portunus trituberculatus]